MTDVADDIQFWQAGEWTMVYLNGHLVVHGDHYHADEWLRERCSVVVVQDDGNASIPDGHTPVRQLSEARLNLARKQNNLHYADELRAKARALMTEADQLEGAS